MCPVGLGASSDAAIFSAKVSPLRSPRRAAAMLCRALHGLLCIAFKDAGLDLDHAGIADTGQALFAFVAGI